MDFPLFATVPKGMESLLAGELRALGARDLRQKPAGVAFVGSLETAYRACLWSRLASRILLQVATGRARDAEQLYATVRSVPWSEHMRVAATLAVSFTGTSDSIRDSRFGAVRVKDAIVDQFRETHYGSRPSVDTRAPDLRVNAHLSRDRVSLAIDLSGDSLHRRGYRLDKVQVEAPLKENLAAAMLLYAEWPREAAGGAMFLDPLCGSGTLPIEAALIAGDIAPGLARAEGGQGFGFLRWNGHQDAVWRALVDDAVGRRQAGLARLRERRNRGFICGSDRDPHALRVAQACVERAGLHDIVALERAELAQLRPAADGGLLVTNAPYGERLGEREEAIAVCRLLGRQLRCDFRGWRAGVLAVGQEQLEALGLAVGRKTTMYNGPIRCTLAYFSSEGRELTSAPRSARAAARSSTRAGAESHVRGEEDVRSLTPAEATPAPARPLGVLPGGGAEQLANRLRKNHKRLARELRRQDISCYRLYDADLPDYNLVVDVYGDMVHVQEYAAPPEIDPSKVQRRLDEALAVITDVLAITADRIVLKQRRRQRGAKQYERQGGRGRLHPVSEDGLTYLVNLTDYLDTGLFIDQRLTRRLVRSLAGGRRFLNLFAYTGTMTVNALAGGASSSMSVDLSSTYLEWAERNLAINGFKGTVDRADDAQSAATHSLVQADCLRWVAEAEGEWDLIWLDPPTFSNSKRMGRATFDVQRDHADLIRLIIRRLLAPDGILLFSTNRRGFHLATQDLSDVRMEDLSRMTLPFDCERSAARHHVFRIESEASVRA